MDPVEAELRAAIVAAPDDDAPRLVFADWLIERGDPRGGGIVAGCRVAKLDRRDPAYLALHREACAHAVPWPHDTPLRREATASRPTRGFYSHLQLSVIDLPALETILQREPIEQLDLIAGTETELEHARLPALGSIRELSILSAFSVRATSLAPVLASLDGAVLRRFRLHAPAIDDALTRTVVHAPGLRGVTSLELASRTEPVSAQTIAGSPLAPALESLAVDALDELAPLVALSRLRTLRLSYHPSLREPGSLLEHLAPIVARVHELELSRGCDDDTVLAIAASARDLRWLSLGLAAGDRGLAALAHAPGTQRLRSLRLRGDIGTHGMAALVDSGRLEVLYDLDLGEMIDDRAVELLAHAPGAAGLRTLGLNRRISQAGVRAIAGSRYLRDLHALDLRRNWGIVDAHALTDAFGARVRV